MAGRDRYGGRGHYGSRIDRPTVPDSRQRRDSYNPSARNRRQQQITPPTASRFERNGQGHPNAPRSPGFDRPPNARRDRSRSPVRRPASYDDRRYRDRSPPPMVQEQQYFLDPFREIDKFQGRVISQVQAFAGIEYKHQSPWELTPAAQAFDTFAHEMGTERISPKDVPGKALRDMTMEKAVTVGHNMKIYMAYIDSKQYEEKFRDKKWRHTLEEVSKDITAGVVCSISIAEHLIDSNVGVDDPSRGSHANGPVIGKKRTVVALRVDGQEAEVCDTTAFGNSLSYPAYNFDEWLRLAHEDDSSAPYVPARVRTIRYRGENHLTKTSYFRFTRPYWISLKNTPVAVEGHIVLEDLTKLADIARVPPHHQLRMRVLREKAELEEAEADEL